MDFLDQLVIPPSANHVMLLKYILTISLLLFVPYTGMMIGATYLSNYFNKKGRRMHNPMYTRFAKDIIEQLTITKSAELALGSIPVLSTTFAYAQLLYEAKTITMGIMVLSALFFIIAFVFIYKYRSTFQIGEVLQSYRGLVGSEKLDQPGKNVEKIRDYEENLVSSNLTYGKIGMYMLLFAAYIFVGSTSLASDPTRWDSVNNILRILFSWQTITNYLYLLAAGGTITGGAILFYLFKWNGGLKDMDEEYAGFVKSYASKLTFVSAICLPLLIFFNFLYLPSSANSPSVYVYLVIIMLLLLVLYNFLYPMIKNSDTSFATIVFVLIFMVFTFNIIKDGAALGNALRDHTEEITKKAEEIEKEAKTKTMTAGGISPDAIYNSKCSACHRFDVKLVGPPYQQTVPKYNGNVQDLAAFIFNPVKKNPDFPPMPNQGLKKKEALIMAQWLMDKVAGKIK